MPPASSDSARDREQRRGETPWETTRRGVSLSLEHTNLISIDSFPAEFSVLDGTGRRSWCACRVVGLTSDEHAPRFVVLIDSGDLTYAMTTAEVRRVEAPAKHLEKL